MGRPRKEPTKTMRVPLSRVAEVKALLSRPPGVWDLGVDESKTLLAILGTQSDTEAKVQRGIDEAGRGELTPVSFLDKL